MLMVFLKVTTERVDLNGSMMPGDTNIEEVWEEVSGARELLKHEKKDRKNKGRKVRTLRHEAIISA